MLQIKINQERRIENARWNFKWGYMEGLAEKVTSEHGPCSEALPFTSAHTSSNQFLVPYS